MRNKFLAKIVSYKYFIIKIFSGVSLSILIGFLAFNNLLFYSINWSGPYQLESELEDTEYTIRNDFVPLQIIQTDNGQYYAIFQGNDYIYDGFHYVLGKSSDLVKWSNFRDMESIIPFHYNFQRQPTVITQLNNGWLYLTRAMCYQSEGYIKIICRESSNGDSWGPLKEAFLNLTLANVPNYEFNYEGIRVFKENLRIKYLLLEDYWNNYRGVSRLISGYIEESNQSFVVEDIEEFSERKIFRDCTLWNDKPTILYRYAYDDVNNVGLAIYNNSMWEYFETVNINHNSYYELLVCNDTLHVIYGDSGRRLQISEIEFNYQDSTWQEAKQSRIRDNPSYNPICDVENSDIKAIMSTTGYRSTALYVEEFDVKQLSGYIVMLTVFLLVLVLPNVYIKIKRRLKNKEVFPEKIPL